MSDRGGEHKSYYEKNKEKLKAKNKEYNLKNKEKRALYDKKRRENPLFKARKRELRKLRRQNPKVKENLKANENPFLKKVRLLPFKIRGIDFSKVQEKPMPDATQIEKRKQYFKEYYLKNKQVIDERSKRHKKKNAPMVD